MFLDQIESEVTSWLDKIEFLDQQFMSLSEGDFVVCYNFPGENKPRSCVVLKIVGKDCILIKVTTTKIKSKNHPQYAFCIPVQKTQVTKIL